MGEKDLTEKQLLELEDVFADIVNVLLFDGKLKECFPNIPPELDPYVSDYKINVFEIAWLSYETISKFKSDFRYVADYYGQIRKTGKWKPMPGEVKHVKELFDLLSVVTSDNRFLQMYHHSKGVVNDMSSAALDYWADVYTNKGRDLAILDSIRSLMKNAKWTAQQAMEALSIPKEDRKNYLERL